MGSLLIFHLRLLNYKLQQYKATLRSMVYVIYLHSQVTTSAAPKRETPKPPPHRATLGPFATCWPHLPTRSPRPRAQFTPSTPPALPQSNLPGPDIMGYSLCTIGLAGLVHLGSLGSLGRPYFSFQGVKFISTYGSAPAVLDCDLRFPGLISPICSGSPVHR